MDEKEPAKKRTRTGAAPRRTKKAPSTAPTKPAPRALVDAPTDQCFWVNQGPILKNLRELCDALTSGVSDEQFAHHVTEERNDFAAWVEVVLKHPDCAQALRRTRTRVGAARAVKKYVEAARA